MDDLDIALELAEMQHTAMLRSKAIMAPCPHCYAVPQIEARDLYGYPKACGWTHEAGCPLFVADWPTLPR